MTVHALSHPGFDREDAGQTTLSNPYFMIGCVAGFAIPLLNEVFTGLAAVKPGEYLLFGLMIGAYSSSGDVEMSSFRYRVVVLILAITGWAIMADLAAGAETYQLAKSSQLFVMLFLPLALLTTMNDPRPVIEMALGLYCGRTIYAVYVLAAQLAGIDMRYTLDEGEHSLKWLFPIPICLLVAFLFAYDYLSSGQRWLWIALFVVDLSVETYMNERTAVAIVIVGAGLVVVHRVAEWAGPGLSRNLVRLALVAVPCAPVIYAYATPLGSVMLSTDSPSNIERVFLIQTALRLIPDHLLFGIGGDPDNLKTIYSAWFTVVTKFKGEVGSTHNFPLDLAVGYGLPAMAFGCAIVWMLAGLVLDRPRRPTLTMFALASIIVTYSVLPLSGNGRLESDLLWMSMIFDRRAREGR